MEISGEFNESLFSTVEVFSTPPSPRSVHFNEDDIVDDKVAYDFGVMPYVFEPRSTVSGSNDVREPQGHHCETLNAADW